MSREPKRKARPYRMVKRAEHIDDTRQKIVEAAVVLHGTVGPSGTTVLGIAERAGVTRATVYRHFADDAALFAACRTHWLSLQAPPDPSSWAQIADPAERLRAGLADLYRFYRAGEPMLTRVNRDKDWLPEGVRKENRDRDEQIRDLFLAAFPSAGRGHHLLAAVLGHAVQFSTWHSLCIDHELEDREAVELIVTFASHWADTPVRKARARGR